MEYESCASCEKTRSWRVHTDTAEHYAILVVLMDYQRNRDAEAAYRDLLKYGVDFSHTENYISSVRALFRQIHALRGDKQDEAKQDTGYEDNGNPE